MVPLTASFSTMSRMSAVTTRIAGAVGALAGAACSAAPPGAIAIVGRTMEASIAAVIVARMVLLDMENSLETDRARNAASRRQVDAGFFGRSTASAMARRNTA